MVRKCDVDPYYLYTFKCAATYFQMDKVCWKNRKVDSDLGTKRAEGKQMANDNIIIVMQRTWYRSYYHPHFTDEKNKALRS